MISLNSIQPSKACTLQELMQYSAYTYDQQSAIFEKIATDKQTSLNTIQIQLQNHERPDRGSDFNGAEYSLALQNYYQTYSVYDQSITNLSQEIQCASRFSMEFHRLFELTTLLKTTYEQNTTDLSKAATLHQFKIIFLHIIEKIKNNRNFDVDHLISEQFPQFYWNFFNTFMPQGSENFKNAYLDLGRYSTLLSDLTHPNDQPTNRLKIKQEWHQHVQRKKELLKSTISDSTEFNFLLSLYNQLLDKINQIQ